MVNVGIVGMGYMGRVHLEAARKVPGIHVVALASRAEQSRRAFADLEVYDTYAGLLRDQRLDAVIICLPTFLHEQYVMEAVERGLDVLCEKPFALDAAAADRMLKANEQAGTLLMIGQVLRFWPQYVWIKELVSDGTLGSIRAVSAFRLARYPPWGEWFRDPAKSGGCLLDLHIHDVDFVHWLLKSPADVFTTGIRSGSGSWDHVLTNLRYEDVVVEIEASFLMPESWSFTAGIRILGELGCVEYDFRVAGNIEKRAQAVNRLRLYRADGTVTEPDVQDEDCFVSELRYFAECVEKRQLPSVCPPAESLEVMRLMGACRRSAESGKVVNWAGSH